MNENKEEDSLLRSIVEGTATEIGDEFFRSLVRHLSTALNVQCSFVAEFTEENTRVRSLAIWNKGDFMDNLEWDLAGTPCEIVLTGKLCHYPNDIPRLFPRDKGLIDMGVVSYLGVPLTNIFGQILGHLVVVDNKPMPEEPRNLSIFHIFASRVRAELERKWAEKALRESEQRLASILSSAMDAIVTIDENERITLFNHSAEKVFRCSADQAINQTFSKFLSKELHNSFKANIKSLDIQGETASCIWVTKDNFATRADGEQFPFEATISRVRVAKQNLYTIILRDINERKRAEAQIQKLHLENLYLQEEIKTEYNFEEIVGASVIIKKIFRNIEQVATTDSTVLIVGETGTGKELIARAIHNRSKRKNRPLIKVNCAALSPGLIESEFFGHEKGAFTGAISQKIGRFELADGGTIFLDEIGDISQEVQAKLLRVLQEQEFERVGGTKTLKVNVRVIAATNRDLEKAVAEDRFRADLYYRLNVFPINLPPLRERKEDIPLLIRYFVSKHMPRIGRIIKNIGQDTIQRLTAYNWPGNIREMENVVERAVILSTGPTLEIGEELLFSSKQQPPKANRPKSLEEMERDHITQVLEQVGWVIEGSKGAAGILGLKPNTLRSRMQKLEIKRPA
jgi:formate hydrogenlyase transcriptional activator